jgi:hypothetical protein
MCLLIDGWEIVGFSWTKFHIVRCEELTNEDDVTYGLIHIRLNPGNGRWFFDTYDLRVGWADKANFTRDFAALRRIPYE